MHYSISDGTEAPCLQKSIFCSHVCFFYLQLGEADIVYPQINFPKKVTERWLNRAFAPLSDYLNQEHPEDARNIMAYMTFRYNKDQRFYYRNCITNDSIVLDQSGELVSCGREALRYKFEYPESIRVDRPSKEERFVHPNVTRWMAKNLNKKTEEKYGEEVCIFLQELWGPIVNFDFGDLKADYPIKRAQTRYCLYLYPSEFLTKIAIQFVGDEIVEKMQLLAIFRIRETSP